MSLTSSGHTLHSRRNSGIGTSTMTTNSAGETPVARFNLVSHKVAGWGAPSTAVLRCALLILGLKVSLRIRGYRRTLQWIERSVRRVPVRAMHSSDQILGAQTVVAIAAALYPGRALCLEQSLALYFFLRRSGVAARLRLGVKAYPFEAHAWIEVNGVPVNDFAEHVRHFVPLPELQQ
jgi:hypothetical protein